MIEHFKHDLTLLNNYYDCYLVISRTQKKNQQTKKCDKRKPSDTNMMY